MLQKKKPRFSEGGNTLHQMKHHQRSKEHDSDRPGRKITEILKLLDSLRSFIHIFKELCEHQ